MVFFTVLLMKVSELSFNESFSMTPVGVTEKFQLTEGGIDARARYLHINFTPIRSTIIDVTIDAMKQERMG